MKLPPLSLYVHLPWCVRKCPYCDFNSHAAAGEPPRDRYLEALFNDIEIEAGRADGRTVETIFIGGGTPSLFSGAEIGEIIGCVRSHMSLAGDAEITMEANPGAVEYGDFGAYLAAGVNRLSIGAQSFDADSLERLGRIHGPQEIRDAFRAAVDAGFDNINIDIMFALPGQTLDMAVSDVATAISLGPQHISYYQLTLEPNTVFYRKPPAGIPDDDLAWSIQMAGQNALTQAGFVQYEVSAFALSGRECRHNLNYWQFGDYLAVGAGAHGKFSDVDGSVCRYQKPAHPRTYMDQAENRAFDDQFRLLAAEDLAFEYMLNILRLPRGFSEAAFRERTGLPIDVIADTLAGAQDDGLLHFDEQQVWRPTKFGMQFMDDVQARFLPPLGAPEGKKPSKLPPDSTVFWSDRSI